MAKVKKYAKGGSYWVTTQDPSKVSSKKPLSAAGLGGWSIDHSQLNTIKK
jgi:hypothetical protein